MSRRLLFIAHSFPPASGSGPNRALALCRYLPAHGWQPTVLTVGEGWGTNRDDSLAVRIPGDARVERTVSFEPRPRPAPRPPRSEEVLGRSPSGGHAPSARPLRRLKGQVAHALRFPDQHVGWTPFAVAAGLWAVRRDRPSLLYSTAAPFTNHLVGLVLHRITRLPWVVELRDGWYRWNTAIFPDYPRWRHVPERGLEGAVVRSAARVVLVTDRMADAFRHQYAALPPSHFAVVPNGFDPEQYADVPAYQSVPHRFRVVHAGALYHGRGIGAFLAAAERLAGADRAFAESFRLSLAGTLDEGARAEVTRSGLGGTIEHLGYLDHRAALSAMRTADLLLLLANTTPGAEATIPAKLFEYLAVGRPILAVAPPGAEAVETLARTRAGWAAPAHDVDSITAALATAFAAHQAGTPFCPRVDEVARFDRSVQAATLAGIFDAVVDGGHRA